MPRRSNFITPTRRDEVVSEVLNLMADRPATNGKEIRSLMIRLGLNGGQADVVMKHMISESIIETR